MAYFLRKERKKKGTYLQMYESFWDKDRKQPRTKNVKSFGYVEDLISDKIPDPIKFYTDYVKEQNKNRAKSLSEEFRPRRRFSFMISSSLGAIGLVKAFSRHSLLNFLHHMVMLDLATPYSAERLCSVRPSSK